MDRSRLPKPRRCFFAKTFIQQWTVMGDSYMRKTFEEYFTVTSYVMGDFFDLYFIGI